MYVRQTMRGTKLVIHKSDRKRFRIAMDAVKLMCVAHPVVEELKECHRAMSDVWELYFEAESESTPVELN